MNTAGTGVAALESAIGSDIEVCGGSPYASADGEASAGSSNLGRDRATFRSTKRVIA